MSPKDPRLTAREILVKLLKRGFKETRSNGSHRILIHPETKRRVTVPFHGHEVLHPKILKSIIQQAGKTMKDLD